MKHKHPWGDIVILSIIILGVILFIYHYKLYRRDTSSTPVSPSSNSNFDQYKYITDITGSSVASSGIEVSSCKPLPQNVTIPIGSVVTFSNNDNVDHTVWFNPTNIILVPAHGSTVKVFDFMKYQGLYSYRCDEIEKAGIIYVTTNDKK